MTELEGVTTAINAAASAKAKCRSKISTYALPACASSNSAENRHSKVGVSHAQPGYISCSELVSCARLTESGDAAAAKSTFAQSTSNQNNKLMSIMAQPKGPML